MGIGKTPGSALDVSGTVKADTLDVSGNVQADSFTGDGTQLTGVHDDLSGFCMFSFSATGCPPGWTQNTAFAGMTMQIVSSGPGGTGGADTHTHGAGSYRAPAHTHSLTFKTSMEDTSTCWLDCKNYVYDLASSTGSASSSAISGTSSSASSWPPYVEVIVCCKD